MNRRIYIPTFLLVATCLAGTKAAWTQAQRPAPLRSDTSRAEEKVQTRLDPYKNYRFRLATASGQYVAGFTQMNQASAGANATPPEKVHRIDKYETITLERGVTQDSSFAQWASQPQERQQLKDLVLDGFDESGKKNTTHKLTSCVVVELQSVPNLDGVAHNNSIEVVKLRCNHAK